MLPTSWKKKEVRDLLSADGGAVVGVRAVGALQPVSVSGGRAAGEPPGQPGVAPPLSAGARSGGGAGGHLSRGGTGTTGATGTPAVVDGERQRLAVVVVLLRCVRVGRARAALLPQVLVLLADAVQLALQLLDAPALGLQELGLALDDVVQLQEVLHRPVWAFRAVLHGGGPADASTSLTRVRTPAGPEIHPSPPALMSGGEGRTNDDSTGD